ncbi:hypothetical protein vseg_013238 [Gypsophila vaccaria]
MSCDLLYILNGIKPKSFQELATRVHDREATINSGRNQNRVSTFKATTEKKKFKKTDKFSKGTSKEVMLVSTGDAPVKISAKPKYDKKKESYTKGYNRDRPTFEELQAKEYPFPDSDLPGMLGDLLEKKILQLPESKRPNQAHRVNDPNYCRYHRLVSHPVEKCITLKEKIMQLAKDGKIILDLDEAVLANHTVAIPEQLGSLYYVAPK